PRRKFPVSEKTGQLVRQLPVHCEFPVASLVKKYSVFPSLSANTFPNEVLLRIISYCSSCVFSSSLHPAKARASSNTTARVIRTCLIFILFSGYTISIIFLLIRVFQPGG